MGESANQPPTDVAELQARLASALAERDAAIAARDEALSQKKIACCIFCISCSFDPATVRGVVSEGHGLHGVDANLAASRRL